MEPNAHTHSWTRWQYSEEYHAPVRYCEICGVGQSTFAWQEVQPQTIATAASVSEDGIAKFLLAIDEFKSTGNFSPEFQEQFSAFVNDPEQQAALLKNPRLMTLVTEKFQEAGLDEVGRPAMNIADYYREGTEPYRLQWPLYPALPLPLPFDELDRKTQFFVLFGEWTRRELEGSAARNAGRLAEAEQIYLEGVERARQIGVAELEARSYEGLVTVAEKRGERQTARKWNEAAQKARSQG